MRRGILVVLVTALVFAPGAGAWAAQPTQSGVVATATSTGLDGKPIQFTEAAFTDAWRQNRYYAVTQTLTGDQLRDPSKPWNAKSNPYEPKCVTLATSNMSGNGAAGVAVAGFVTNLPNAGGLIGMGALLRPTTVNQSNGGGNSIQSQGQGQKQGQLQTQNQGQSQNAFGGVGIGGAGGAGGNATINAAGGVGNTSIKATGNAKINTGDASVFSSISQ